MTDCEDHRPLGAGVIADSAGRHGTMAPRGLWFSRGPRGTAQTTGAFVWLAFILFPAVNAFAKRETALHHVLTIAGAMLFVVTYIALVSIWRWRYADQALPILFAVLVAVAIALTLSDGTSWGFLFTYCAASAGLISRRFGFAAVIACSVLAGVTSALGGASGGQVIGWVASSAGIGMLILVMRDLRLRNEELSEARGELARMAVAEERERFARDLHDLLGHSLSVIALKAELAGRMLAERSRTTDAASHSATEGPSLDRAATEEGSLDRAATEERSLDRAATEEGLLDRAATEVRELEQVARTALGEVREAVSGYRQPTLAGELAGARMALSAAGIEADVQETQVSLEPGVEAVLAWAVREGATNVIRHSGAQHCTLRITASLTDAGAEVIDDGPGAEMIDRGGGNGVREPRSGGDGQRVWAGNGISGHGLAGLAERARLLNGMVQAGPLPGGGYRLAVTVPVSHA